MWSKTYDEFDEFAGSIRGVDSKMMFRNASQRKWTVSGVDLGGVEIQLGQLGSGNIAQGELRPDGHMVYLPLTPSLEYSANGCEIEKNAFAFLEPSSEFCISTKLPHDWCVAFVSNELLADVVDLDLLNGNRSAAICGVTPPTPALALEFRTSVKDVLYAANNCKTFSFSPAAAVARDHFLSLTVSILQFKVVSHKKLTGRLKLSRSNIIERAMAFVDQHSNKHVNVSELASEVGVSERTLRNVFTEYFFVSPSQYLKLRQLHLIHKALLEADPLTFTVTSILVDHGEWEMSRFAKRYKAQYGEVPSETLKRKAK